jgi:SAM-dependent methyltransferase
MQGGKGLQPYADNGDAKDERNSWCGFFHRSLPKILQHTLYNNAALEIGSGNGRIASRLALIFDHVVGIDPHVDPSPQFHHPKVEYLKCSWQEYKKTGWREYDLILFWGSFYLFADEGVETLAGCAEILSDGGVIVIADDFHRNTDRGVDPISDGLLYSLTALRGDLREVHEHIQDDYLRVTVLQK